MITLYTAGISRDAVREYLHGAELFLRRWYLLIWSRNSPPLESVLNQMNPAQVLTLCDPFPTTQPTLITRGLICFCYMRIKFRIANGRNCYYNFQI